MFVVILVVGFHYAFIKPVQFGKNKNFNLPVPFQIFLNLQYRKETIASKTLSHFQKDYFCTLTLQKIPFGVKFRVDG